MFTLAALPSNQHHHCQQPSSNHHLFRCSFIFFPNILTFVQNRAVFIRLLCTFCPNVNFYQCYLFLEEDPARSSQPQKSSAPSQKSESSHRFGLFGCPLPRYGRPLALVGWTTLSRWLFTSQKVPPSGFQILSQDLLVALSPWKVAASYSLEKYHEVKSLSTRSPSLLSPESVPVCSGSF